ncbi:MAG: tRNA dihydrouridine synthase, partial [Planctomycetaceae bacterium]
MNPLALPPAVSAESTLAIGGRLLPSRFFLAPLAGYTQLPFRRVVRELGGLGLATTDLVQAIDLVTGRRRARDIIETSADDKPLSVQIFGSQTARLVEAARWLEDNGYLGVDINMGCPMAKVNGQGGGARLMCDVVNAVRTAAAVVESVRIPVTVKMRLGWDRNSITSPKLAREFER